LRIFAGSLAREMNQVNREITKSQFLVLYVSFGVSLLAFKEVADASASLWSGIILLAILFVLFLPWFLELPGTGWRRGRR